MNLLDNVKRGVGRLGRVRSFVLAIVGAAIASATVADKIGAAVRSREVRRALGLVFAYRYEAVLLGVALIALALAAPNLQEIRATGRLVALDWKRGWKRRISWVGRVVLLVAAMALGAYQAAWFWKGREVRDRVGDISFVRHADSAAADGRRSLARFYLESCDLALHTERCASWLQGFNEWDAYLPALEALKSKTPVTSLGYPRLLRATAEIKGDPGYMDREVEAAEAELKAFGTALLAACEAYRRNRDAVPLRKVSERYMGLTDADRLTLEAEAAPAGNERGYLGAVARLGCTAVVDSIVENLSRSLQAEASAQREAWSYETYEDWEGE